MAQIIDNSNVKDISVGLLDDIKDELVNALGKQASKEVTSIKEKQRKVMEFKSRVNYEIYYYLQILELMEIFVKSTKNPQMFIVKLEQFMSTLHDYKHANKSQYIKRCCKVMQTIIQKNDLSEYLDSLSQCLEQLIGFIHKCQDNGINNALSDLLESIIKGLHQTDTPQAKKIISNAIVKGIGLMKKNSNIKVQLIKKLMNQYSFSLMSAFPKICQMCQINGQYDRSKYEYSSLLQSLIDNNNMREKIINKQKLQQPFIELMLNVLDKIEEQKYKKISIFRRMLQCYIKLGLQDGNMFIYYVHRNYSRYNKQFYQQRFKSS